MAEDLPSTGLIAPFRAALLDAVASGFETASLQSAGFALRLLAASVRSGDPPLPSFTPEAVLGGLQYGGYPELAYLGFAIGAGAAPVEAHAAFVDKLRGIVDREGPTLVGLLADDLALLGVADGVVSTSNSPALDPSRVPSVNRGEPSRIRTLALDLLDPRSRLAVSPETEDLDAALTDLALQTCWPAPFRTASPRSFDDRSRTLARLLSASPPGPGDLDRAVTWATALDALVSEAAQAAIPSVHDVARLLRRTQGALKRWVWESKERRAGSGPAKWLIDNEYHVQDLLYAILNPVYGAEVVEEQFLQGFGFTQPRLDLAINDLSLIIEVKFARTPADYKKFEGEIAADLGLYFGDQSPFEDIIVYVYDDCDNPKPERYDAFRDALMQRDARMVDVIIVRRPSMIPNRRGRGTV